MIDPMSPIQVIQAGSELLQGAMPIIIALFGPVFGIGLGLYILRAIRPFFSDYNLVEHIADLVENLEGPPDFIPDKPKVNGWQLGDDGEMIPVVSKRKNDDMFHQN